MTTKVSAVDRATDVAHSWVRCVVDEFGTEDEEFAYRMLSAWLHALRDRLTTEGSARFAAQLPVVIRGIFYAGWHPGALPPRDAKVCTVRFAREAMISVQDVAEATVSTTSALLHLLSPAQVHAVLDLFPETLRLLPLPPVDAGDRLRR